MNIMQATGPTLIPKKLAARRMGKTVSGLNKYMKKRSDFPRPIKDGPSRQSAVYFVEEDITQWIESLIENDLAAGGEEQ